MNLTKVNQVIQELGRSVLSIGQKLKNTTLAVQSKTSDLDVVSRMDIEIDDFLATELFKHFPDDRIISEESNPLNAPTDGRVWVVDPLCGSKNASRGINFFCTNIALVVDGKVVAAWVIDHSRGSIIWSVGHNQVFEDSKLLDALAHKQNDGWLVNFDYGNGLELSDRDKYSRFVSDLIMEPDISVYSLCSSLAFAYSATGQIDAAVTLMVKPWDVIASCFLVEQNGGFVAHLDGSPWSIDSRSVVFARSEQVGTRILQLLHKNGLK